MIDLHMHTNASDGDFSAEEVVDFALKKKLNAIAITDHDTIANVERAVEYAKGKGIEVVTGIEVRANEPEAGFVNIDVIGLFVDVKSDALVKFTRMIKEERINQNKEMIKKLQKFGYKITFEEVAGTVKGVFGKPHLARILINKYSQEFSTIKEVFDRYLGVGKPAFVERKNLTRIKDAVKIIHDAGGISILAHPGVFGKEKSLRLIKMFKDAGGMGMETYYPYYIICTEFKLDENENKRWVAYYKKIAEENSFVESGGNDFHDLKERNTMGLVEIPDEVLNNIKRIKRESERVKDN